MSEWGVALNGAYLSGGNDGIPTTMATTPCSGLSLTTYGCLSEPPAGLGLPAIRGEDVTFPQRDGVKHYSDWYDARVVTIKASVGPDGCGCSSIVGGGYVPRVGSSGFGLGGFGGVNPNSPGSGGQPGLSAKQKVRALLNAWGRSCADEELVIFTDCHAATTNPADRATNGPFGVIGRPRVADLTWAVGAEVGDLLLRFDAVDHRAYILDACGTPGSGGVTTTLYPISASKCRTYGACSTGGQIGRNYPGGSACYTTAAPGAAGVPVSVTNSGDLCAYPTVTLIGGLTNPRITVTQGSVTTTIIFGGLVRAGQTVIIDTYNGTATDGASGQDLTYLLQGALRLPLYSGQSTAQLVSFSSADSGRATLYFRPAVDVI